MNDEIVLICGKCKEYSKFNGADHQTNKIQCKKLSSLLCFEEINGNTTDQRFYAFSWSICHSNFIFTNADVKHKCGKVLEETNIFFRSLMLFISNKTWIEQNIYHDFRLIWYNAQWQINRDKNLRLIKTSPQVPTPNDSKWNNSRQKSGYLHWALDLNINRFSDKTN